MKLLTFALLSSFMLPTTASAVVQDEIRRFKKCYGILVGEPVMSSDPLFLAVKNQSKTGTAACMEIFERGELQADNQVKRSASGGHDPLGIKVLRSIQNFHLGALEVPHYDVDNDGGLEGRTPDMLDFYEHAYHMTYNVLKPGEPYSRLVTRANTLRAIRNGTRSKHLYNYVLEGSPGQLVDLSFPSLTADGTPTTPVFVPVGTLLGIGPMNYSNHAVKGRSYVLNFGYVNSNEIVDVNRHFGAGMIGTQAYIKANANDVKLRFFDGLDGATEHLRRWGKHVINDLLCRDLPSLYPDDVTNDVRPASTIAYRKGVSCMQCHSSMDPLADTIRNIRANTDMVKNVRFLAKVVPETLAPKLAYPYAPLDAPDYKYSVRPAVGKLRYRSYDGAYVESAELDGLPDLGDELASQKDFYVCAAKKYYRFLTGISANLADLSAPGSTLVLTPGEAAHRQKVIELGLSLQQDPNQSVKTMFRKIIESPTFVYPGRM